MKKNEYVSPEMEIVEVKGQYSIMAGSDITGGSPSQGGTDEIPDGPIFGD